MELLSVAEAAGELGLTTGRVYQFISGGRLKVREILGRKGITRSELERFRGLQRPPGRRWPSNSSGRESKPKIGRQYTWLSSQRGV